MKITLKVPDMTCDHCKMAISKAIRQLDKIEDVVVDLNSKLVKVIGMPNMQEVVNAVKEAGYTVEEIVSIQ